MRTFKGDVADSMSTLEGLIPQQLKAVNDSWVETSSGGTRTTENFKGSAKSFMELVNV